MNKPPKTAMPAMPSSAEPNEAQAEVSRRAVLKLTLAASGLLAAGGLAEFLTFEAEGGAPTTVELEQPAAYAVGSATHLAMSGTWLLRDPDGLYAISTRCPHLGCTVERQAGGFRCPCHGSRFTPDGQVQNGPATRPLAYLKLTLSSEGRVLVHTDQPASATERLT